MSLAVKYLLLLIILTIGRCNPEPNRISYKGSNNVKPASVGYKVIAIKDGDTFVLLLDGKEQVVRLAHIDCPEKKQPFGGRAKQFASDLCFGKKVALMHHNKYDRNKRLIAEVILEDGQNINKELVRNGLAWHFKKYSDNAEYAALEIIARQQRKGLWADEAPVAPWNWRRNKKRASKVDNPGQPKCI